MKNIFNKEDMMIKFGKWIAKHKVIIVIIQYVTAYPVIPGNGSDESKLRYPELSAGITGNS